MSGIATVSFHKYRGPGAVTFDKARVPASKQGEMVAHRHLRSRRRICCGCRRTTSRAKAAAGSSAAGRIHTSRSRCSEADEGPMTHGTIRRSGRLHSALGAARPGLAGVAWAQASAPTFSKDVAPIFQEKCEACPRADSIAPMSLVTYQEARPWARAIKARVADHTMPPWDIDKTVGVQKFKNDRSLSDAEVETILRWVDAGAPQGDPQAMPAPRTWPEDQGWNFAALFGQKEPDMIIKSHPFTMPAQSQDAWDKRMTPSGLTEPRWVRAIEIRRSRSRAARSRITRSPTSSRTSPRRPPRTASRPSSWSGRSASRAS